MPVLVMFGLVACAASAGPPRDLIAKDDHAALAAWYTKQAADLRWKVEEMRLMREMYETPSYQPRSERVQSGVNRALSALHRVLQQSRRGG